MGGWGGQVVVTSSSNQNVGHVGPMGQPNPTHQLQIGASKLRTDGHFTELGTSLYEIAQLLFALERTLISGANERFKKKSNEQTDKIQILNVRILKGANYCSFRSDRAF